MTDVYYIGDVGSDAPPLAARGPYTVGVRALHLTDPNRIDLLGTAGEAGARYDRPLTVEVWYPAQSNGQPEHEAYNGIIRPGGVDSDLMPFVFHGRAIRDAAPVNEDVPYPLVVVSHGYPGSRFMFTYLTENLASKGHVVVSIDHTDSTYADVGPFSSSLLNRAMDQQFVIGEMIRLNETEGFLRGLIDADAIALIGLSMGGFGVLNTIGAGYNALVGAYVGEAVTSRLADTPGYAADPRVKAAVLIAPWGGDLTPVGFPGASVWNADAIANVTIPTLWIIGTQDETAVYSGMMRLFDEATHSDRVMVTYEGGPHNVGSNAPMPFIRAMLEANGHCDDVWDAARMNAINQHVITAFLRSTLRGDEAAAVHLREGEIAPRVTVHRG